MNGSNLRPWQVIRQDENGGRYRIGHCATRAEAHRLIRRLESGAAAHSAGAPAHYLVERVEPGVRAHR
ncbi:SPOR domain-containing protein [Streptomyces sp. B6B3]|jgi:hypothetical protein|uniref:SPOR domain-containing protein n=1 Tax=Streptomyces sp. B6B3 TaxID=3153570 RepID=UPI00325F7D4F